ncbi:MAG TPA: tripartite tricarboxylate transporter substrate binding protein [Burkholderiales bacterium]|nr:tripartite tricarboxylate transporter substrate binding protein [Burkholderiales bacterium]
MAHRVVPALAASCVLLCVSCASAYAQAWPARPVRVIAPFAPGGTADTLGRVVSAKLAESLGQSFIVENRTGAGGVVGSEVAAKSAPDGYTLVVSGVASHVIAAALTKVPFDPLRDFTHIALFGGPPAALAVHPSLPAKDLKTFIALARSRPGQLTYGSPGNGTQGHLVAHLLQGSAGVDIRHVPYRGASLAVADAIAGNIHAISTTLSTASGQIRSGRLRALALSSEERLPDYRDIPTFRELGFAQLVATVWFGLSGPAGIPADIVSKLNAEVARILALREVRDRLRAEGMELAGANAKPYAAFVASEIERWTPIVRASGAKAD